VLQRWQPFRFEEGGAGAGEQDSTTPSDGDEELLVIFPRIYSIEDEPPDPITDGVVLMKSQSTAATAEVEIERRKPSSPTVGKAVSRPRPNKSRNKSISLNPGTLFYLNQPRQAQIEMVQAAAKPLSRITTNILRRGGLTKTDHETQVKLMHI